MFQQIKSSLLVAITFGVVMSCSTPALAQLQMAVAERYKNNTGTTALCLRKVVYNWAIVGNPQSDKFATCTTRNAGLGYTVIDCSGTDGLHTGEVANGGTARVAFLGTAVRRRAEVISAKWYSNAACTTYIAPYAEPVPFIGLTGNLSVTVEHGAEEWTDPDGPTGSALGTVYGRDVQYAIADYVRPLEDLNEDLFTSITWTDMDECDFELTTFGATDSCSLGALDPSDVVLLRFYTGASGTDGYELVQFRMSDLSIPTMTEWGVVVMTMLLLTAATIVYMRKRAVAT